MADWTPVYTRAWGGTPGLTGLIDAIGTNDGVDAYVNPHTSGKGVVAQSSTYSTYVASNAIDHSLTSHTHSTTSPTNPWWSINFGEKRVKVTRVGLYGVNAAEQPRNFLVQGSNDGVSWTTLATVTGEGPTVGTWWTKEITGAVEWSRLRIYTTGNNSSGRQLLEIGEFEIWGEYLEYTGPQSTMVGHEAARVLRQGTDVPVRVGHTAARVLREQGGIPVRVGHESARVLRSAQPVGTNALITSDTGVVLDRNSTSSPSSAVFVVHNPRDSGDVTVQIPNGLWGRATLMNLVVHGYVAPVDPEDFGDWEPIMSRVGNHTHDAADIVSGTLNADRLPVQDGLVVKSPDGSRWRISVDDVGDLSVNPL